MSRRGPRCPSCGVPSPLVTDGKARCLNWACDGLEWDPAADAAKASAEFWNEPPAERARRVNPLIGPSWTLFAAALIVSMLGAILGHTLAGCMAYGPYAGTLVMAAVWEWRHRDGG